MKTKIYLCFILSVISSCCLKAQYSQSTTLDFNANANFNISTSNDELKLTPDLGTGADGDLYIAPGGTAQTDNIKTYVTGMNPSGQNALQVGTSSGFNIGDEVLIITMRDNNTDMNNNITGQYEFGRILTKLSTALILTKNLLNAYDTTTTGKKHQVIKVPNYNNVTIDYGGVLTCDDWDGSTGGIICFRAKGMVYINSLAKIDATAKGYLGGPQTNGAGVHGKQGESILGIGIANYSNNLNSGGGGQQSWSGYCDAGGGGGSYATMGSNGGGQGCGGGGYVYGGLTGISVGNEFLTNCILVALVVAVVMVMPIPQEYLAKEVMEVE
jgi:hypothetical protein